MHPADMPVPKDIESVIEAAVKVKRLREELAQAEAELAHVSNATTTRGSPPPPPRAKKSKANGKVGPSFTDQVLKHVTGTRTAESIVTSMGLRPTDRRRVYDVLKKAAINRRIRKLGAGRFGPKQKK